MSNTVSDAQMHLIDLEVVASNLDETEIFVWLDRRGVPLEVNTRLKGLWNTTRRLGGQLIHIGRIIIMKVLSFIQEHPHTAIGIALGASIGALVSLVPWIGPLLAPLTTAIGAAYGAMRGLRLDNPGSDNSFDALIQMAKEFFHRFAEVMMLLKDKLEERLYALR